MGDQEKPKTLFTSELYRIPALIYVKDCETFFSFAEKRMSEKDVDAEILVMSKGKRQNKQINWSRHHELKEACMPGYRTMNPCPVYEKESKTLFLFFICVKDDVTESDQINLCEKGKNTTRLCYITSKNNGESWSRQLTDLTEQLIGSEIDRWATFAVGPGHGIQMKSGRLVIPAYVYYIEYKFCFCPIANPYALAFYSDDKGQTWKMGKRLETESLECQMAEIPDQRGNNVLYCNARGRNGFRVEAWSEDCEKWNILESKLTDEGCQGSVLSFSPPDPKESSSSTSSTNTWLLYSHPSDPHQRRDLGIYLRKTPLDDKQWEEQPWIINPGPSGYSDLTQCEEPDHFACLMECGDKREYQSIALVEFTFPEIIKKKHPCL